MNPDCVPWGRVPVAALPTPPFADHGAFQAFHRGLAEHLACLAQATGGVDIATGALVSALHDVSAYPQRTWTPTLAPWVLRAAVATYFPAPWTPVGLVEALDGAGLLPGAVWRAEPDAVGYRYDPDFIAERDGGGHWTARFIERGEARVDAEIDGDHDLVLYLMEHVRGNPYPYGWRADDPARLRAIAEAARPTLAAWEQAAALPYLSGWSPNVP